MSATIVWICNRKLIFCENSCKINSTKHVKNVNYMRFRTASSVARNTPQLKALNYYPNNNASKRSPALSQTSKRKLFGCGGCAALSRISFRIVRPTCCDLVRARSLRRLRFFRETARKPKQTRSGRALVFRATHKQRRHLLLLPARGSRYKRSCTFCRAIRPRVLSSRICHRYVFFPAV